jgi:hypothetical protein
MRGIRWVDIGLVLTLVAAMGSPIRLEARSENYSWMTEGAYAEYGPAGRSGITVFCYNSSLDLTNCTLWKDGGYTVYHSVDIEAGDTFLYRWEVAAIIGTNVTLSVQVTISNWMTSEFNITINMETAKTYAAGLLVGYSRLWFLASQSQIPHPWMSNPALAFGDAVSPTFGPTYTIQGLQQVAIVEVGEEDYRPPEEGYRSPFRNSLAFDADTGLLVGCGAQFVLPFPPEARFIAFAAGLALSATNIDLGPALPDVASLLPGFLIVGAMMATASALTVVFFVLRRSGRGRRRIRRVRRRS